MTDWKWVTVLWHVGPPAAKRMLCVAVSLPGVLPDHRLTPRVARQAALAAVGQDWDVWVTDEVGGYVLSPGSARAIERRVLDRYTIEAYSDMEAR